ncbi:MAG: HAMP domain-containing histidine kinase [Novosphingobium sp.]|nr:HAMP domain-containing histidine kinase [Novosphingobium sp.]
MSLSLSIFRPSSLRLRFMIAITLWVMLGVGTIWWSATRVFTSHVEASYHEELEVHVHELIRLTRLDDEGNPTLTRPLSDPRYEDPLSGFYWQVWGPNGKVLHSASMTHGELRHDIAHSTKVLHDLEKGPTGPAITYGVETRNPDGTQVHYVIATDQAELDRLIDEFTRELTLWLAVLALLLLGSGALIIHFGLQPLTRLGQAVGRLRSGGAERLEGDYPAEIAPVVTDFNAYVGQNTDMITRARVQAGNLAHSLRTPLAVIMDEADRLSGVNEAKESAEVLLAQSALMQQQIDYQLARARSTAGVRIPGKMAELPELVVPILSAMRRLHPDVAFKLNPGGIHRISVPVDPVDLSELLSILIDNAGKFASGQVTVTCHHDPAGMTTITVSDDGPGMKEHEITKAFDIGSRFDPAKPGSGLGLAIGKDIAEAAGISLKLRNTVTGFEAVLSLPNKTGS